MIWPLLLGLSLVWIGHAASEALAGDAPSILLRIGALAVGAAIFLAGYSPVLVSLYRGDRAQLKPPVDPAGA